MAYMDLRLRGDDDDCGDDEGRESYMAYVDLRLRVDDEDCVDDEDLGKGMNGCGRNRNYSSQSDRTV